VPPLAYVPPLAAGAPLLLVGPPPALGAPALVLDPVAGCEALQPAPTSATTPANPVNEIATDILRIITSSGGRRASVGQLMTHIGDGQRNATPSNKRQTTSESSVRPWRRDRFPWRRYFSLRTVCAANAHERAQCAGGKRRELAPFEHGAQAL